MLKLHRAPGLRLPEPPLIDLVEERSNFENDLSDPTHDDVSSRNHMDRRDSRHRHGCRQAVRLAGSGRGGEPGGTAGDVGAAVNRQRIHRRHQRQGGRSQYLPETARSLTETLMLAIGFAHEIVRLQG